MQVYYGAIQRGIASAVLAKSESWIFADELDPNYVALVMDFAVNLFEAKAAQECGGGFSIVVKQARDKHQSLDRLFCGR